MPDTVALERALAARAAEPPAAVEWHAAVSSTSDRLKALAREGAAEWTVVLADEQSGGRGREGREWASPPGGLYVSVLLRPRVAAIGLLPLAAGLAVVEAVAEHGVAAELKWPNDVVVGGRKLAGVLSEAATGAGGVEWVAIGIGVNVAPSALPAQLRANAATLADGGRTPPTVAVLAAAVLARLRVWYDALGRSPRVVLDAWRRRALAWWGETVEVRTAVDVVRGRLLDLDDEGALLVSLEGGGTRRVLSGEVSRLRRVE
jgi:BirA family biotin operon repressor/biotin-[acetyl-CoA-carboxylase] ligase